MSSTLAVTSSVRVRMLERTGMVFPHAQMSLVHPYTFWATSKCGGSDSSVLLSLVSTMTLVSSGTGVGVVAVEVVTAVAFVGAILLYFLAMVDDVSSGF